jgi:hypothetical protein
MKRCFIILILFFTGLTVYAQDESGENGGKIRDRMNEYIQDRLGLSRQEADKFSPLFLRYFQEFRQIHRENKSDMLMLKQKVIDLRIRYRTEFRQIMDEPRANKVFVYEDEFRRKAIQILEIRKDRLGDKRLQRTVPPLQ